MPYEIKDGSGDRKYFTLVPNYILNHSTALDQAVYMQMKRVAGEEGECFMSQKTLCSRLKIGRISLKKSIDYLIKHGWIEYIGETEVESKGGKQKTKTYRIKDIWKENIKHYEQGGSETAPLKTKGVSETTPKGGLKQHQGGSETAPNKNPIIKTHVIRTGEAGQSPASTNELIELFKEVNPSYKRLFANTTQRAALERMVKEHDVEKVEWVIKALRQTNGMRYAPTITTPIQLENKLGELIVFLKKENNTAPKLIKI